METNEELLARAERAEAKLRKVTDAGEMLWVVIANVSGANWSQQTPEWQAAAAKWRDNFFEATI